MAFKDIRDYFAALEQRNLLRRVTREVDHNWEVASLAKWMFQAIPYEKRTGLFFEKIKGSKIPVATGAFGASPMHVAVALGAKDPEGINDVVVNALRNPIPPRMVKSGPCQENVLLGKDAKLSLLPIPTWTPGKDAAPYITCLNITKDHDTGVPNNSVYRSMVKDDHTIVASLSPGRQSTRNMHTWWNKGKKAPIAWVIAVEPVCHFAAVANLPYGRDEMAMAGGMKGEAIELVQCKTVDLAVPAHAEIIIEAEIAPNEWGDEGPFGEFAGYMGVVSKKPVAHVTAITYRNDPIYYGYTSQMPPSESTTIQSLTNAGVIKYQLIDQFGQYAVKDVWIDQTFGGMLAHCVVAMTPQTPGHGKLIGRCVADMSLVKRVTVVDEDVDIRDSTHVEWAMNARYSPSRDTVIIDDVFVPLSIDPSVRAADGTLWQGSKIICDATQKIDSGPFSLPPKATMEKALVSWKECGLPDFEIPKRVKLRIDKS